MLDGLDPQQAMLAAGGVGGRLLELPSSCVQSLLSGLVLEQLLIRRMLERHCRVAKRAN